MVNCLPETRQIRDVFAEVVEAGGGQVSDEFDDGDQIFLRSIFPEAREVQSGDPINGGVALKCHGTTVLVQPYLFRQVCRNGAITASVIETCEIERVPADSSPWEVDEVVRGLRHAIDASMDEQLLSDAVSRMRSAADLPSDMLISMLSHLSGLSRSLRNLVLREFAAAEHRSAYGVFNAMTAVARDTRDPGQRWRLEEAAGGMLARLPISPQVNDSGTALSLA